MNFNDNETARRIIKVIDQRVRNGIKQLRFPAWTIGKVDVGGTGDIPLFINGSANSIVVRNPNGLTLNAGDLVFVWMPNGKLDNMAFINHKL